MRWQSHGTESGAIHDSLLLHHSSYPRSASSWHHNSRRTLRYVQLVRIMPFIQSVTRSGIDIYRIGSFFTLSYFTIPPLLNSSPALLARQWRMIYDRSQLIGPPTVLISSLCFGFLAYVYRNMSSALGVDRYRSPLFLAAGLITISVLPYTRFVMQNVTRQLNYRVEDMEARVYPEKANENSLPKGQSTKELVNAWATLNFFMGFFPLVGAVLAVTASLGFDWMGLADYRLDIVQKLGR